MTMKMAALAATMALALGACAAPVWYKDGATQSEFDRARYECERDTRQVAGSFSYGLAGAWQAREFAERCMGAKGFAKVGNEKQRAGL